MNYIKSVIVKMISLKSKTNISDLNLNLKVVAVQDYIHTGLIRHLLLNICNAFIILLCNLADM